MKKIIYLIINIVILLFIVSNVPVQAVPNNLYVQGRFLRTPCGDTVVIRGINKMIIYTSDTALRRQSFAEIKKTGANCARIVWLAYPTDQEDATPAGLDRNIQACIDNGMIPMVELHDATGDWTMLQKLVDYWTSKDVLDVIKKHEKYLIINIGNEVGDDQVTNDQFKTGYENVVMQMRNAGIHTPFVIDAAEWGKNLDMLVATGQDIINSDPDHNIIFSVHMYWAISEGADAAYITNKLMESVNAGIPLIVGEFTGIFPETTICNLDCDYNSIMKICNDNKIGYIPWEWGPGNGFFDKSCDIMDMTSDSYFANLKDSWAKVVAETSPYSIANTSVTPKYIILKGNCEPVSTVNDITSDNNFFDIYPNPLSEQATITIELKEPGNISLKLYNSLGELVSKIAEGYTTQGVHQYNLNTLQAIYSGIYYCQLTNNMKTQTKQITVVR